MTQDQFIADAEDYVAHLLAGLCAHPFELAHQRLPWGVRFVARLDQLEFDTIRYSDLYPALQNVIAHVGKRHADKIRPGFRAEFKLYDPYFADLSFRPIDING